MTDIIQLIIPILKRRTKGFTSFPSIFCFNPSPSRGSPVLAQKWHGFSKSSNKIVCLLFGYQEKLQNFLSLFQFSLTLKKKYLEEIKFLAGHPFKKQIQWFLKYIFDSVTSFLLPFSIYLIKVGFLVLYRTQKRIMLAQEQDDIKTRKIVSCVIRSTTIKHY